MTSDSDVGLPPAASMFVRLLTADAEMQILRALVKHTGFHYSAFSPIFQHLFFHSHLRSFLLLFPAVHKVLHIFCRMPALILSYLAGRFFSSSLSQSGTIIAYEDKTKHIQADHFKTE